MLLILLFTVGKSIAQPVEIITFAYPPYINGDGTGMVEKIVSKSFEAQNQSVKYRIYPLKRAIENFQQGQGQLFIGLPLYFPGQEIDATEIFYYRRVLVYLKEQYPAFYINSLTDLKGKTVGMLVGASQDTVFQAAGLTVDTAPGIKNNIEKLYLRRVDFVATVDLAAINQINETFPGQLADFGFWEFDRSVLDLIARRNSSIKTIYEDFRAGLKTIIRNGTYQQIQEEVYGPGQVPASAQMKRVK